MVVLSFSLIVLLFVVLPHLNFHDVDHTYLSGMLEALPHHIAGDVDVALHEQLQYPTQLRYGKEHEMLRALAIKLKLKNVLHFEKVQRQLGLLLRVAIDTKQDYNSAIRSVTLQVKLLKHLKNDAV